MNRPLVQRGVRETSSTALYRFRVTIVETRFRSRSRSRFAVPFFDLPLLHTCTSFHNKTWRHLLPQVLSSMPPAIHPSYQQQHLIHFPINPIDLKKKAKKKSQKNFLYFKKKEKKKLGKKCTIIVPTTTIPKKKTQNFKGFLP